MRRDRKGVTALFAELVGSTALTEALDPEYRSDSIVNPRRAARTSALDKDGLMLTLDHARVAIRREMRGVLTCLASLEDDAWSAPTRCAGWSVADLVAHLVWGQRLEAGGLRGAAEGRDAAEVPDAVEPASPDELQEALRVAHAGLDGPLEALDESALERLAPMPFGLAPVSLLLQVITMEVGVHASDLREAVGGDGVLEDDVVAATATVLGVFLPALAANGTRPPGPVRYRLLGDEVDVTLGYDGTAWATGGDGPADATFRGRDSDLVLFALGRGSIADRRLEVDGDLSRAERFRAHVPGI